MSFDPTFLESVRDLYVPRQGTERMAELLYLLIRFVRPRSVIEAGMGYTTPFIAKALRDNDESWIGERENLLVKTHRYVAEIEQLPKGSAAAPGRGRGLAAAYSQALSPIATRRMQWLFETPALARSQHYRTLHSSRAYCIDNLCDSQSTAHSVLKKLQELGLSEFVSVRKGDFHSFDPALLPASAIPIDMIWIDLLLTLKDALSLIEGRYWSVLNPDGGLLLIHCMLTSEGGQAIVREFEAIRRQSRRPLFEMVGLIEPHKLLQNNVLIIRKAVTPPSGAIEEALAATGEGPIEKEARHLIAVASTWSGPTRSARD